MLKKVLILMFLISSSVYAGGEIIIIKESHNVKFSSKYISITKINPGFLSGSTTEEISYDDYFTDICYGSDYIVLAANIGVYNMYDNFVIQCKDEE